MNDSSPKQIDVRSIGKKAIFESGVMYINSLFG